MIPFRVFDRDKKHMWQVINYQPDPATGGGYLATREDDSDSDGDMMIIAAKELVKMKFVDFLEDTEIDQE